MRCWTKRGTDYESLRAPYFPHFDCPGLALCRPDAPKPQNGAGAHLGRDDRGSVFMKRGDQAKLERLIGFAEYFANCPCCQETLKCDPECTFREDVNADDIYQRMVMAREALTGKIPPPTL